MGTWGHQVPFLARVRLLMRARLRHPPIPVLLVQFAAPHSYTGEDVLELQGHAHGGRRLPAAAASTCRRRCALATLALAGLASAQVREGTTANGISYDVRGSGPPVA